jgi:hypothetical protein
MSTPQDRLLDAIFPDERGSKVERMLSRCGRGLGDLADRRCGLDWTSDQMPTGVWAVVNWLGMWMVRGRERLMYRRWRRERRSA